MNVVVNCFQVVILVTPITLVLLVFINWTMSLLKDAYHIIGVSIVSMYCVHMARDKWQESLFKRSRTEYGMAHLGAYEIVDASIVACVVGTARNTRQEISFKGFGSFLA